MSEPGPEVMARFMGAENVERGRHYLEQLDPELHRYIIDFVYGEVYAGELKTAPSEIIQVLVGKTLAANPGKRLYSASKIPPKNRRWPSLPTYDYNDVFPADHVFAHADMIRRALGVDTIDLLQFHVWDDSWTDRPEFRNAVEKLKHDKIIHAFGLSLNRWQPANGIRAIRTGLIDAVQVIYNVFDQNPEDELFPVCREHNIGVIARVPLDEGSLGGKMTRDTTFPDGDWRKGYFNPKNLNATLDRVDRLREDVPSGMTLQHHHRRHAQGRTRPRQPCPQPCWRPRRWGDPEDAQAPLGAQSRPVVGLDSLLPVREPAHQSDPKRKALPKGISPQPS